MMPATASPPQRRRQFNAGYSLVEVLITIVIMALITGLVFQGLGGAARLALRLSDEADRLDRSAMTSDWWRMSVVSALPSAADPEAPETPKKPNLVGTADRLSMETVSSLTARFGAPREVVWSIVKAGSTSELVYEAGSERWVVARSRKNSPHFAYRARTGVWETAWNKSDPPVMLMLENFFDTPVLAHPRSQAIEFQPSEKPPVGF